MEALALVLGCVLIWVGAFGAGRVEERPGVRIPRADRKRRLRAFVLGVVLVLLVAGNAEWSRGAVRTAQSYLAGTEPADSTALSLTADTTPAPPAAVMPAPVDTTPAVRVDTTSAPVPEFGGFRTRTRVTWTIYSITYVGEMSLVGTEGSLVVSYQTGDGQRHKVLQDLRLERTDGGWFYMGSNPRDPVSRAPSDTYQPDFFHVSFDGSEWKFDQGCDASACVALQVEPIS